MRNVYDVLDRERYTHRDPNTGRFWDDKDGRWVTENQIFKQVDENGNTKESSSKGKENNIKKEDRNRERTAAGKWYLSDLQ